MCVFEVDVETPNFFSGNKLEMGNKDDTCVEIFSCTPRSNAKHDSNSETIDPLIKCLHQLSKLPLQFYSASEAVNYKDHQNTIA
jgi:hypothetical protein